jgi:hypothetical protein
MHDSVTELVHRFVALEILQRECQRFLHQACDLQPPLPLVNLRRNRVDIDAVVPFQTS